MFSPEFDKGCRAHITPKVVWTGSFNPTCNGTNSIENAEVLKRLGLTVEMKRPVKTAIQILESLGYTASQTSRGVKKCPVSPITLSNTAKDTGHKQDELKPQRDREYSLTVTKYDTDLKEYITRKYEAQAAKKALAKQYRF